MPDHERCIRPRTKAPPAALFTLYSRPLYFRTSDSLRSFDMAPQRESFSPCCEHSVFRVKACNFFFSGFWPKDKTRWINSCEYWLGVDFSRTTSIEFLNILYIHPVHAQMIKNPNINLKNKGIFCAYVLCFFMHRNVISDMCHGTRILPTVHFRVYVGIHGRLTKIIESIRYVCVL